MFLFSESISREKANSGLTRCKAQEKLFHICLSLAEIIQQIPETPFDTHLKSVLQRL